ncbi:hypothetical protein [Leptolyngbya sp. KIOST-1]|uniref:DUF7925 domain-containing protein n=1 Tax=Leptolyngbya sp. KIOST-1 TaxID=1229172 RepID=UPI0018CE9709|nr:hypothetical protein [Leptolyngbya sp. KIOST-1]
MTGRPLLVTLLVVGSTLQILGPVLAQVAAGTAIRNTATATYEDPSAPGVQIDATSNTVEVVVAEVGGVTVTGDAVQNLSNPGGQILPNDQLAYDFEVTNVGNFDTNFHLPATATVTGAATAGGILVSLDGGTTFVPLADVSTNGVLNTPTPAGGSILVRVPVTVNANAPSGAEISVRLGDTAAGPDGSTQNQPDDQDGPQANEVRTTGGSPVNGQREAQGILSIQVGSQPQAFATLLKSRINTALNNPNDLTDVVLTYGLSLRVEGSAPVGSPGFVAAALAGQSITVNGTAGNYILVSDAIPAGTVLTGTPSAPAGWQVVYTTAPTTTFANAAAWTTIAPGDLSIVTRIGFVRNTAVEPTIAAGTTVTGFTFQVVTSGVDPVAGQSIENLGQVFGATAGNPNRLVYDESGDQNPNNLNDDGTPGPGITSGVANSAIQGVDPNSGDNNPATDNQGIGPGGEVNVFVLLPPGALLHGPQGQPAAVGPTSNNDDFTNQAIPGNVTPAPGAGLAAPVTISFTNTVQNPGTAPITNILLVPRDLAAVAGIDNTDLPNGTVVEIVYNGIRAPYTYNQGTGTFTFTGGAGTDTVRINSLPAGTSVNYTVNVTLPAGTGLSTENNQGGYPVPVVAFSDTGIVNGLPDAGEAQNLTINRSYVGYLRLSKEVRILNANGTEIQGFTDSPNPANIVPGNILEYRIVYNNISEASTGSGNVTLNANNVVITEDGTTGDLTDPTDTGNTWALEANGVIITSNVQGMATATQGPIMFANGGDRSGPTQATDVIRYVNTVGVVQPQADGSFTFRRRIN